MQNSIDHSTTIHLCQISMGLQTIEKIKNKFERDMELRSLWGQWGIVEAGLGFDVDPEDFKISFVENTIDTLWEGSARMLIAGKAINVRCQDGEVLFENFSDVREEAKILDTYIRRMYA